MRLWLLPALALTATGCAQTRPQPSPAAQVAPSAPPAVAPPPAPAAPAGPTRSPYAVSIAMFRDGELDECTDLEITPKAGQESAAVARRQKIIDSTAPDKGEDRTAFVLEGSCNEQIAGRSELARCDADQSVDLGRIQVTSGYFKYSTLAKQDDYLRECLGMKGQWHTNANAMEHARLQGQMRRLEKMADGN